METNNKMRVNPLTWLGVESGIITAFKRSVHLIGNPFRFEMANRRLVGENDCFEWNANGHADWWQSM